MLDSEQSENVEVIEEVVEAEAEAELEVEGETPEQPDEEPAEATEDDELVVTLDGEEPNPDDELFNPKAPEAPAWVRDMRKTNREQKKRIRELEKQLESKEPPKQTTLGPKPKLADHSYDSDKYEKALDQWYEQKRAYDAEEQERQTAEQQQQETWNQRLAQYEEAKTVLKVKDFEDAEENVLEQLNQTQQGMIVSGAENPALLVYALGKNPKILSQLASIKDPVRFLAEAVRLEATKLKTSSRKAAAAPEKRVSGAASSAGSNATLEKLRAEAERTGDFTKVMQYRRQLKAQNKM